jgi:hypothetical protein
MHANHVKSLLKSVWQKCPGKEKGTEACTIYVTKQVVYVRSRPKKLYTTAMSGLDLTYDNNENIVEGQYCSFCAQEKHEFLRQVHSHEKIEIRDIPGIEEAIDFLKEK